MQNFRPTLTTALKLFEVPLDAKHFQNTVFNINCCEGVSRLQPCAVTGKSS